MVVDPTQPEKGVFTAFFKIPSSCSCSIVAEEESAKQALLDQMMNTKNRENHKTTKPISTPRKDTTKQNDYSSYDYNYGEGYFDEETTTSHSGRK